MSGAFIPRAGRFRLLVLMLGLAATASGCDERRAQLDVGLTTPTTVAPFVVHGNCMAGWTLSATLTIRNIGDDRATLTSLTLRAEDPAGRFIASEVLDATSLVDRYGAEAIRINPGMTPEIRIALRVEGPLGETVMSGSLQARDSKGTFRASFRFTTQPVNLPPPSGGGGACDVS